MTCPLSWENMHAFLTQFMKHLVKNWKNDLPSSLVVFLVALPLCLGVGLASTSVKGADGEFITGLPIIFSGLIAGVIGGIIVGSLSGSRLGVSGPAAGLITIVTSAILTLGSFEAFLVAVMLSGVLQIIAGYLKAGVLSSYFPSSVIKGMLAAIGITLIMKEIPHAFGYDEDFMGDESFFQMDGENTFSEIWKALGVFHPGAIIISFVSIAILAVFERKFFKQFSLFKLLPAALIVVLVGVGLNAAFGAWIPELSVTGTKHLVSIPVSKSLEDVGALFTSPDFSALSNPNVYVVAFTIAIIGSLETLLSVEATDKLDPDKNHTPTNRELKAQGVGNIVSGLVGGLPITQVIVRSSANINSGAKSKLSAIMHGFLLFGSIVFIPKLLNLIPLSALAGILIMIGYKLARISLFKTLYKQGWEQFLPFISTIIVVQFTDLLTGIAVGIAVSIFYILRRNYRNNYEIELVEIAGKKVMRIKFLDEVTFLNKAGIYELLTNLEPDSTVELDATNCRTVDHDTLELIRDFERFGAKDKGIDFRTVGLPN